MPSLVLLLRALRSTISTGTSNLACARALSRVAVWTSAYYERRALCVHASSSLRSSLRKRRTEHPLSHSGGRGMAGDSRTRAERVRLHDRSHRPRPYKQLGLQPPVGRRVDPETKPDQAQKGRQAAHEQCASGGGSTWVRQLDNLSIFSRRIISPARARACASKRIDLALRPREHSLRHHQARALQRVAVQSTSQLSVRRGSTVTFQVALLVAQTRTPSRCSRAPRRSASST